MELECLELGPFATNAYILWEAENGNAVLFDAPLGVEEAIPSFLKKKNLALSDVYLTHGHWDHMAGASDLVRDGVGVLGQLGRERLS